MVLFPIRKNLKRCGFPLIVVNVVIIYFIGNRTDHVLSGGMLDKDPRKAMQLNKTSSRPEGDQTVETATTATQKPSKSLFPTVLKIEKEPKRHHLLVNAYMNSGSRFTGSLFGFRKDIFFFYEPLWKASVWDYYKTPNLACNSISGSGSSQCKPSTAASVNKRIGAVDNVQLGNKTTSEFLLSILEKIYRCDFSHFDTLVVKEIAEVASLSGPSWDTYRACMKSRRTPKRECIKRQEALCKKAKHIVTKVLRMTVGSLEPLLRTVPDLKIIQLMRDPRAIINSRIHSQGYPARDYVSNSKALCQKMTWDLEEGLVLMKNYPDRFKFVFYEDVKSDVLSKARQLSNFIGMEFDEAEVARLNKVSVNKAKTRSVATKSRVIDNAFWWRTSLSLANVDNVQRYCSKVFDGFDLKLFHSKADLTNASLSTFVLPNY